MQLELKKSFALSNGVRSYLHKIVAACEGVEKDVKNNGANRCGYKGLTNIADSIDGNADLSKRIITVADYLEMAAEKAKDLLDEENDLKERDAEKSEFVELFNKGNKLVANIADEFFARAREQLSGVNVAAEVKEAIYVTQSRMQALIEEDALSYIDKSAMSKSDSIQSLVRGDMNPSELFGKLNLSELDTNFASQTALANTMMDRTQRYIQSAIAKVEAAQESIPAEERDEIEPPCLTLATITDVLNNAYVSVSDDFQHLVEYILKKNYRHNNALELAIGHAHKIAETNLLKARAKLPKLMTDYLEANTDVDFEPIPKDF